MRIPGITTAAVTVVALAVLGHGLAVPGASMSASTAAFLTSTESATSNSTSTELETRGELAALEARRRRRKGGGRRKKGPKNNKVECSPEPCTLDCDPLFILITLGTSCLICHVITDCPQV
ncbi:hypothetical protein PspLS_07969 [Pyricularia sp. CBS 133598]|nr:hypothetical protein PspLS_07969 [Pyricularia sp. CBS 133598]